MKKRKKKCKTCNFYIGCAGHCVCFESQNFGENVSENHRCGAWRKISKNEVKFMELDE